MPKDVSVNFFVGRSCSDIHKHLEKSATYMGDDDVKAKFFECMVTSLQ